METVIDKSMEAEPLEAKDVSDICSSEGFRSFALEKSDALYRIASRMVDRQSADDLVQEALTRAFASRQQFRGDSAPFSWLCGILMNLCRGELRRRRVKSWFSLNWFVDYGDEPAPEMESTKTQSPIEQLEMLERDRLLREAVATLPENQKAALILVSFEAMSVKETALCLKTSEDAVWKSLSRGRATLRRTLNDSL